MKMVIRFSYFSICAYLMMAHVIVGYAEDMTVANISAKQMNVVKQSKAVEQTVIIEPEKATEHTKSIKSSKIPRAIKPFKLPAPTAYVIKFM